MKLTTEQKRAISRIRRAGITTDLPSVIAWVCSVNADTILATSLREIRAVASTF